MSQTTTPSAVLDTYRALHPKSEALYARARGVTKSCWPAGVTIWPGAAMALGATLSSPLLLSGWRSGPRA